jgi:hypothetical protein
VSARVVYTKAGMRRLLCLLGLMFATPACADDATVRVKVAEGFTPAKSTISVLGVFRDGRMSVDAWGPLSLPISAAIGASQVCEPAFSARLQRDDEPLFASIDDQAKNEGITEDLLARLAPSAQGDLILSITMHGSVGPPDRSSDKGPSVAQQPSGGGMPAMRGGGMGGMGGMRGGAHREPTARGPAPKVLEISGSLFSTKRRIPLARMTLTYMGQSADDAVKQFAAEIGKLAPGSACKGWSFAGHELPPAVAPILDGP